MASKKRKSGPRGSKKSKVALRLHQKKSPAKNKTQKAKSGKKIIMLGPQGSGKGTQAILLSKKLSIPHISTGDIFRELEKKDTPLGKEIRRLIDHGMLAPDELTNEVVKQRLSQKDCRKGFILDGYPRNISQAHFLEQIGMPSHCIFISLSEEEAVRRISARRTCGLCKANYNLITSKPKKDGRCDKCSGTLIARPDDKPAAIRMRLKEYHLETEALIEYYSHLGILKKVDGNQPVAKVFSDIFHGSNLKK